MNGGELFVLARTLMKLAEEAMPTEGLGEYTTSTRSVLVVSADVAEHEVTSVGEITRRTGLPQSQVSGCVARLREAGAIITETDPADRRRVLIRKNPETSERVKAVRATTIDATIRKALGGEDPTEVIAALQLLADRL